MSEINKPLIIERYDYKGEEIVIKVLTNCPNSDDQWEKNFPFGVQSYAGGAKIYDFGTYNYKRVGPMKKKANRAARKFIRTVL